MLRTLREECWIMDGRGLVKMHIRRCVICARQSTRTSTQLMGNLPESRVTPSSPFSHTSVDHAGPFGIIPFARRGQRTRKHYVALFVCLVSDSFGKCGRLHYYRFSSDVSSIRESTPFTGSHV
jgi:hypothetical protein